MSGRRRRLAAGVAVVIGACAVLTSGSGGVGPNGHRPKCTLVDGVMHVDGGYFDVDVRRQGDRIVTTYSGDKVVDCGPVEPTVTNVDRMELPDEGDIDLRGGPFAPGLTPEPDGSSEIEISVAVGLGGPMNFLLGGGDDHVSFGSLGGKSIGINLNSDESSPDVDVVISPASPDAFGKPDLRMLGGPGDDVLDAHGGPGFRGPSTTDLLELRGGPGDDLLAGGSVTEILIGGAGRDRILGGPGDDLIGTRDGKRDRANCGKGKDIISLDDRDAIHSCELKYRKGNRNSDD